MNTTTDTATASTKTNASTAPAKTNKTQRHMARPAPAAEGALPSPTPFPNSALAPKPATGTKTTAAIALLERGEGATLAELIAATGWLPHTTRAALTGLRKKGHAIERSKRGEETCYRIVVRAPGGIKAG